MPTIQPRKRPEVVWRLALAGLFVVTISLLGSCAFLYFRGLPLARQWVQSATGRAVAGRGLGKIMKVDGTLTSLRVKDWTVYNQAFVGAGWPGEAIANVNFIGIKTELDPSGLWHGVYRIKSVQVDSAEINLRKPNDALKRPVPAKKPRPWYAFFLPSRFECGPITCPDARLLYQFQGQQAEIQHAHVRADLFGRDLKYTVTAGLLHMPYLPPLAINRLEMLVTRPAIRIYTAQLQGLQPGSTTRVEMAGRLGMRQDKSIAATCTFTDLPIQQVLPEELQGLIQGSASGQLNWNRDKAGQVLDSDGILTLAGASVAGLAIFKEVKLLNDNPALDRFDFDDVTCRFHVHRGRAQLDLDARSQGKFTLHGIVVYQLETKLADLNLTVTELPLQTWLPAELKPRTAGTARAQILWHGHLDRVRDSNGTLDLNLDGAAFGWPTILRTLSVAKGLHAPEEILLKTAHFQFTYNNDAFQLTQAVIDAPTILSAHLQGQLSRDRQLSAHVSWNGLRIEDWLQARLAGDFSGSIQGQAQVELNNWKVGQGNYAGKLEIQNAELRYTPFQSLIARFLNDRRLLEIPLTRANLDFNWHDSRLEVRNLDLRGGDELGVQGGFQVDSEHRLSGRLWVGVRPDYLSAFSGLGSAIFFRRSDGLSWAQVRLSGTAKKPQQDLLAQFKAQLSQHPTALLTLGTKLVSWVVGNWFNAGDAWERPSNLNEAQK